MKQRQLQLVWRTETGPLSGSGTAYLHTIDLFTCCADKSFTVLLILNVRLQTFSEPESAVEFTN